MADLENYPPDRRRSLEPLPLPGNWKQFTTGFALCLGSGIIGILVGSGLDVAIEKWPPGQAQALMIALATTLLFTGPILAWGGVRLISTSPMTRKFKQGLLSGTVGFYVGLMALYFAFFWGHH